MVGKAVFLLIASAILGATALLFGSKQSSFESQSEQSEYQASGIAHDIATSGYNEILSTVRRQKMNAVGTQPDVAMLGGSYSQTVTENIYGDLDIRVEGEFTGVEHVVASNVIFETPFPGAIALSDDEVEAEGFGSGYTVSGMDGRAPSRGTGGGFLRPVAGILTDAIHAYDVSSEFLASRVRGLGNEDGSANSPSVSGNFDEAFYEAIYQEALTKPYTLVDEGQGGAGSAQSQVQSAASSSSANNPKIIRALGGLMVNYPVSGHGLLIVENGDLNIISSDFNWEGLVLVRKQTVDTVRVDLGPNTAIQGGFVGYSVEGGGEPGDCAGDFAIDGNEIVAQEEVRLKFTVLGAAISAGGSYDMPVTVKIRINGQGFTPFGSWGNPILGNVNTGNTGTTYVWEPEGTFPANSRIRIGARSWKKKKSWYSGSKSSHWKKHMTKDNLTVDDQLAVLRDESPVPDVGGYMGQYSVEDFISEYIDTENDEMKLEASDAIYLYELGMNNPASSAHDMQDLVMLVTMTKAGATSGCEGGIAGVNRIEFKMMGDASVRYSGEALAKLGQTLDTIAGQTRVVVTQDEIFTTHAEGSYDGQSDDEEGDKDDE